MLAFPAKNENMEFDPTLDPFDQDDSEEIDTREPLVLECPIHGQYVGGYNGGCPSCFSNFNPLVSIAE